MYRCSGLALLDINEDAVLKSIKAEIEERTTSQLGIHFE
jgi:hypothetical protein